MSRTTLDLIDMEIEDYLASYEEAVNGDFAVMMNMQAIQADTLKTIVALLDRRLPEPTE